jgi:hypothetical protein
MEQGKMMGQGVVIKAPSDDAQDFQNMFKRKHSLQTSYQTLLSVFDALAPTERRVTTVSYHTSPASRSVI